MREHNRLMSRTTVDPITTAASHVVMGQSLQRVAITFFAPASGQATISNETPVTSGNGIVLIPGQAPVVLSLYHQGDCVQREWYVIYSGLVSAMTWIETLVWGLGEPGVPGKDVSLSGLY